MKRILPIFLLLLSACGKVATEPETTDATPPEVIVPVLGAHEVRLPKEVILDSTFNRVIAFSLHPTRTSVSPQLGKPTDPKVDLIVGLEHESHCFDGEISSAGLERLTSHGFARIRAIDIELTPDEQDGRPSNQNPAYMCFGVRTEGGRWEWRPRRVELVYDAAEKRLRGHFELETPLRADAVNLLLGTGPRLIEHPVDRVTYEVVE